MDSFTIFGNLTPVVLVVFYCLQNTAASTSGTEAFSYEYLDAENTILKLRCDGGCSKDITVLKIVIYNHTDMTQMCAATPEKTPTVFKPLVQDISYYVAGGLFENDNFKSCQLELLIPNSNLLTGLHFGCNVTHSDDIKGGTTQLSRSLTVDRKVSQQGSHNSSPTITVILIGVIIFLFFLSIFFLSMWLRDCCRRRDELIYQFPPHRKVSNHVYQEDTASVVTYASSPAIDMKDCEFKFQSRNASVRRKNSRKEANVAENRAVYPVLPPSPPPQFLREKNNSQRTCNAIKVPYTYARPQDAIEPDFSEDGDVASSIGATRNLYFETNKPQDSRQGPVFYSSVAINNPVDL